MCNEDNNEVIVMSKKQCTFCLNEICKPKLQAVAQSQNRSMSKLIKQLCRQEIKRHEEENGEIIVTEDKIGLK